MFKEVPQHNAVSPLLAPELQYIYIKYRELFQSP